MSEDKTAPDPTTGTDELRESEFVKGSNISDQAIPSNFDPGEIVSLLGTPQPIEKVSTDAAPSDTE